MILFPPAALIALTYSAAFAVFGTFARTVISALVLGAATTTVFTAAALLKGFDNVIGWAANHLFPPPGPGAFVNIKQEEKPFEGRTAWMNHVYATGQKIDQECHVETNLKDHATAPQAPTTSTAHLLSVHGLLATGGDRSEHQQRSIDDERREEWSRLGHSDTPWT